MAKKHLEKSITKYIRVTKHFLRCPKNCRNQFIQDMKHDIATFLLENQDAKYSDIIHYFGTPAELAQTYLDNVPPEELNVYNTKRKFGGAILGAIIIIVPCTTIIFLYLLFQKARKVDVIYVEESIKILEDDIQ